MPAPVARDLRERIVRAVPGGSPNWQAALRFDVSPSGSVKLMRRFRQSGSSARVRLGSHRCPMLDRYEVEIQAELHRHGFTVGATSTISRCSDEPT